MKYPTLTEMQTSREWTDVFLGYNHNLRIGQGEFYDMTNMTGDDYPVLSPRAKRGAYVTVGESPKIVGLISKDALCYIVNGLPDDDGNIIGGNIHINKEKVYDLGIKDIKDDKDNSIPKKLVSMGAYIIILPDKKYINTASFDDRGDIENHFISTTTTDEGKMAYFMPSLMDGADIKIVPSPIAPTITEDMLAGKEEIPYWYDTSKKVLKLYSLSDEIWTTVSTTYVRIISGGIGKGFEVGDTVTISGVTVKGCESLNATATITSKGEDNIVVTGLITPEGEGMPSQETPIVVSRWMPDLDYICESQNRLWGCRYGAAYQGKRLGMENGKYIMVDCIAPVVNEIYSCKLGDFKNWNTYQGIASDSYAVTVGTDGHFTGAITHLGYPIFFKENYMHKIYGNFPSNFQVQTTACRGVQKGCDRSLATVNEVVYYKSQSGVMGYDGSLPAEISGALGDKYYTDAVAGALGNKYYVSMKDNAGEYHLFVYDTKKAMWHREDATQALMFSPCRGDLYFIDYSTNSIMSVKGNGTLENDIEWSAVTGLIGTDTPDKKYISRLDVRMKLIPGATVSIYAEYDSMGSWELLCNMTGRDLRSFAIPIKPKRCDHMRLKFVGKGDAKIFSICKNVEWGSDK